MTPDTHLSASTSPDAEPAEVRATATRDAILDTVVALVEESGYDGFYVRDVAKRAHVSLKTIYKWFPTRDDLVIAAISKWHQQHSVAVAEVPPTGLPVRDALLFLLRQSFEPWERSPNMLKAYTRSLAIPAGAELHAQSTLATETIRLPVYADVDPAYADDVKTILYDAAHAAGARFSSGVIDITELREYLERVVDRLTSDNTVFAAAPSHPA